jgi:hypothetical protein
MIEPNASPEIAHISQLLDEYSFDVENYQIETLVASWLNSFEPMWVNHAITEALYQGRYKIVSVHQILQLWQRRGQPIRHFNREFESIILGQSLLSSGVAYGCIAAQRSQEPAKGVDDDTGVFSPADNDESAASSLVAPLEQDDEINGANAVNDKPHGQLSLGAGATDRTVDFEETPFHQHEQSVTSAQLASPPNFRPVSFGETETSLDALHPEPIRPFVPKSDISILHQRLRAVARDSHEN